MGLSYRLTRRRLVQAAAVSSLGAAGGSRAGAQAGMTPPIGVHLVAWDTARNGDAARWERAVGEIADSGFRRVTFVTYRFADRGSGGLSETSRFGADPGAPARVLSAAMDAARRRGLDAAVYPIVEIDADGDPGHYWRGDLVLRGAALARFFESYSRYVEDIAVLSRDLGARRVYIGSELAGLSTAPAALPHWHSLIARVRTLYSSAGGRLIYAANYDEYKNVPFWDAVDEIGINAYFPLFAEDEASGPGSPSVALMTERWQSKLREMEALSRIRGRPVLFSEWGAVPFDLASTEPWNIAPSDTPDPGEQADMYRAVLEAARGSAAWLSGIDLWHWRVPGDTGSPFVIDRSSAAMKVLRPYLEG